MEEINCLFCRNKYFCNVHLLITETVLRINQLGDSQPIDRFLTDKNKNWCSGFFEVSNFCKRFTYDSEELERECCKDSSSINNPVIQPMPEHLKRKAGEEEDER